jgi:hypothetical protein
MQEITARHVKCYEEIENPGDFYISSPTDNSQTLDIRTLFFQCPCGCKTMAQVAISLDDSNAWMWDGNEERPTITPGISIIGGCRWYGRLTNGIFISCQKI